ncbi:hypothetical protein J2T57_001337 [Natronocella acetinitrilica]|uniref:Uncharacterized protein n=1 Tax=Natronocella acetinitrilica TaxID=414046 RepID=A0AAE3G210_9GAMM|nr:hypothetical protein [Natronocella acetinitrilica]MCP1674235.1 hypothetical protein [Natronocella acetinitrilica]
MPIAKSARSALCALALAGVLALGAQPRALEAAAFPTLDLANLAINVAQNMLSAQIFAEKLMTQEQSMASASDDRAREIERTNEDTTNLITRINQRMTDLHNEVALAGASPNPYACEEVSYTISTEEAACAAWDYVSGRNQEASEESTLAIEAAAARALAAVRGETPPQGSAPGASSQYVLHPNREREAAILARAGLPHRPGVSRDDPQSAALVNPESSTDAGLIIGHAAETLTFDADMQQAAEDFIRLATPPGESSLSTSAPTNEMIVGEMRKVLFRNAAYATMLRLIGERVPGEDGLSSYAMVVISGMALTYRDDAEKSLMEVLADGKLTNPEQVQRIYARLLAQHVWLAARRYREGQQLEYLAALRLAAMIDPPRE